MQNTLTHNSLILNEQLLSWGIQHRRHLHQHPEVSLQEIQTAAYCKQVLQSLGYRITDCWGTGFYADLPHPKPQLKTIAWRADMDALPIQEGNTHEFVSKHSGIAHLCGHDVHMAIALCAAKLVAENTENLTTNVRFLFQPSEETPPGGAPGMIQNGCLENVDEVYGLHNHPGLTIGQLHTRVGPLMAAADNFSLVIGGRGGHAARPHDCLDPIFAGSQLINRWQACLNRFINPAHSAVISVTQFVAGDTYNVIPDNALLKGTVRTFDKQDRQWLQKMLHASLQEFTTLGFNLDFNYITGYDAVINHCAGVERITAAANKILTTTAAINANCEAQGWGEDFCYYLQHRPGAFFFLGSGNPEKGITAPIHSTRFDVDERVIELGARIVLSLLSP